MRWLLLLNAAAQLAMILLVLGVLSLVGPLGLVVTGALIEARADGALFAACLCLGALGCAGAVGLISARTLFLCFFALTESDPRGLERVVHSQGAGFAWVVGAVGLGTVGSLALLATVPFV